MDEQVFSFRFRRKLVRIMFHFYYLCICFVTFHLFSFVAIFAVKGFIVIFFASDSVFSFPLYCTTSITLYKNSVLYLVGQRGRGKQNEPTFINLYIHPPLAIRKHTSQTCCFLFAPISILFLFRESGQIIT